MAKKTTKKTVEEVVEEVKAEDIPVEVVAEKPKGKRLVSVGGKEWYEDVK